ncbi:MAG: hypothetical protein JRG86_00240 [Deltaproteobacteria bacterium]|jgi:hypothetical protein|nr:hypothetical protein [Deltaproteobacteria bacterium]
MSSNHDAGPPGRKAFFEGFAWPVPRAFDAAVGAPRFEQGDVLYADPAGYADLEGRLPKRLMAIQVLAKSGRPAALNALLAIAKPKRRSLLGLRPKAWSKEALAAVRALRSFDSDERARRVLEAAAKSRDTELARAAGREG